MRLLFVALLLLLLACFGTFRPSQLGLANAKKFPYKSFSKYEKGPSLCTCYGPCPDGHCPAANCTGASKFEPRGRYGCGNVSTSGERELAVFAPPSTDTYATSKITMMWFTTDVVAPGWPNTTIFVYIDGEREASVSFRMYEAMAMPSDKRAAGDVAMFQSKHTGKGGIWGGLSFFRDIPFFSSARITAKASELDYDIGVPFSLYYRVAGIYGAPVRIGDLELPAAARLSLTRVSKFYQPLEHIYAYDTSPSNNVSGVFAGLIYLAKSHSAHFLEGIWETSSDGEPFQDQGAGEDLLLSENYADAGWFGHQLNGVPHRSLACITDDLPNLTDTCSFSGYRWYDSDPIIFEESLIFRGQVGDPATHNKRLFQTHFTTLAWVYTWPNTNNEEREEGSGERARRS